MYKRQACVAPSAKARTALRVFVLTHPPTFPVEQPIDLIFNGPAHMTFLHVGIKAWPIAPWVGSLFNRLQGGITPVAL